MASTRKTTKTPKDDAATSAEQAARLSRSLSGTAQQIWLAGIGALARAQTESTKLFEGLVKEGLTIEQSAMKFADTQAHVIRNAVESGVDTAAARAAGTWDQLESAVEGGVRRALVRLGVPDRDELAELSRRVESLSAELRKRGGGAKAATSRPAPARKAAKRAPAKAAAPARPGKKAVRKSATKAAKAPTPR